MMKTGLVGLFFGFIALMRGGVEAAGTAYDGS